MIVVICDSCREKIQGLSGYLLTPPDEDGNREEHHLCGSCTDAVLQFISNTGD